VKPGEVIVDIQEERASNVIDFSKRVERLKQDGRKTALLLVADADGNMRFVAVPIR
jgi:serine protease Do